MNFNNTDLDTQPVIQEYKPEPTWTETYKAGIKNFTSVHLSTSEVNYYSENLRTNIKEWVKTAPENEDVFKRVMVLSPDAIENYENLYSKGKLDVIADDKSELFGMTGGNAFLQYKEIQKQHGFKDLVAIKTEADAKAKSDYLESSQVLASSDKWSAKLAGGAVGVMNDPITLATLPVGSWKTGGTIIMNAARAFGEEALIETAAQTVIAPKVYSYKNELDIKTSLKDEAYTALTSIATAGMFRAGASSAFDLTEKGIKALKAKDPSLAEDYQAMTKGQATEGVEGHIDNLHRTEFGDSQVTEIKDPNAEGAELNKAPPISEYPNVESLVLKDKGQPLKVFHGTDEDFEVFDFSKFGKTDSGFAGKGIYFTNSKEIAKDYTTKGIIKESYLEIKKPLVVDTYEEINDITGVSRKLATENSELIKNKLEEKGYDGIIIRDKDETGAEVNEYVVFNPNQIKTKEQVFTTPDEDLSMVIGKTEDGQPEFKSYKDLDLEHEAEDTMLTNLQNCLKGAI